jgi:hypothetical protein
MAKINARQKGHAFERAVVLMFKALGWVDAMTTRLGSKMLDNMKIDIMNVDPFTVQCKAVESLNVHKAFNEIPKVEGKYRVLFHKKNRTGTLVVMEVDEWLELIQMLKKEGIL